MGNSRNTKTFTQGIDGFLLSVVAALIVFGFVMVYSSSAVIASQQFQSMYFFVFRQIIWIMAGIFAMFIGMRVDYKKWASVSREAFFVVLLLLIVILVTPLGHSVGGAQRWFRIGPFGFQPSEMAKVVMVIYMSKILQRKYHKRRQFNKSMLPPLVLLILAVLLVYRQPDFGTAIFMTAAGAAVFFVGGVKIKHIAAVSLAILPVIMIMLFSQPYRRERILTFLNPTRDIYGAGFQLYHSITALGSGGVTGLGLGAGFHKLFYIPEVHTDFVFAVIGQELGFIGTFAVIILFCLFIWRGLKIAVKQEDYLGRVMAAGLTFLIAAQAAANIAVVTGLFPTKGLPLPFLSFGGSSLFFNMLAVGILLNISKTCWKGNR